MTALALAAVALVALGLGALAVARRLGGGTGTAEGGRIVMSDTTADRGETLYAPGVRLYGRPDYVVEERVRGRTALIPVEAKPMRRSRRLYESDEMQAIAYLLILRETHPDAWIPFARVVYAPDIPPFTVEPTRERIARCLAHVEAIRKERTARNVRRSHDQPARCRSCAVRDRCNERLS